MSVSALQTGMDDGSTQAGLLAAAALCRHRGVALTDIRRQTLELLWRAGRPLSAYQLLAGLKEARGRPVTPPTIYRALEFLVGQGLAIRIESRNAYVPCTHPERLHARVFFVCDCCDASMQIENPTLLRLIGEDALNLGFQVARPVLEMQGTCAHCRGRQETRVAIRS